MSDFSDRIGRLDIDDLQLHYTDGIDMDAAAAYNAVLFDHIISSYADVSAFRTAIDEEIKSLMANPHWNISSDCQRDILKFQANVMDAAGLMATSWLCRNPDEMQCIPARISTI